MKEKRLVADPPTVVTHELRLCRLTRGSGKLTCPGTVCAWFERRHPRVPVSEPKAGRQTSI